MNRYKKIKNTYFKICKENSNLICPQVNNSKVYFNNHGMNHLLRKNGRPREYRQICIRISLLKYCKVILCSNDTKIEIRSEIRVGKLITYWGISKNISTNLFITVVVRKIGNGKMHFYSIFKK